jgi:uncharacterized protein YkwD
MRSAFTIVAASLFVALAITLIPASSQARPEQSPARQSGSDLLAAVNALRVSHGLPPYNAHPILMQIAQAHADYMAATGGANGHTGPGGTRPIDRAIAAGYSAVFFSENWQAGGSLSPAGAVTAWQGDAPHLNTMLSASLVDAGAGVSKSGGTVYYVLDAGGAGAPAGPVNPGTPGTSVPVNTVGPSQFMVPVALSTPDSQGLVYHEVAHGQTLWSIAIAYDTKIEQIRAFNNLSGLDIYPGQKLLIKQGVAPAPAPPTPAPTRVVASAASPTARGTFTSERASREVNPINTPAVDAGLPEKSRLNLTVIAIIGAALLFAALGTWMGIRKPE